VNLGFRGSTWLGSPGAKWMTRNETMETKKRVMIFCMILRPINDNIKKTPHHRDTEITERKFSFARSGDGDRAKKLSPSGGLYKSLKTTLGFYGKSMSC
jgi:hypothetical protein